MIALLADAPVKQAVDALQPEQYLIKTLTVKGRPKVLVAGGDPIGALRRLSPGRALGVRFYLHGDVVPDGRSRSTLAATRRDGQAAVRAPRHPAVPRFPRGARLVERRRLQGHPRPAAQAADELLRPAHLSRGRRRPRAGGLDRPARRDRRRTAQVKASYPSRHFTTANADRHVGLPAASKTGDYVFGAADLFDRDDYGADYMRGHASLAARCRPSSATHLFDRMGALLREAFTFAHRLGIKTCLGTETPLTIPDAGAAAAAGGGQEPGRPGRRAGALRGHVPADRADPSAGLLLALDARRLDLGGSRASSRSTRRMADFRAALAAPRRSSPPSRWPPAAGCSARRRRRRCSTSSLPKNMPMSCINRQVGNSPVEPGFAKVRAGRNGPFPGWKTTRA